MGLVDTDAQEVRRATRVVAVQIAIAAAALVVAVLIAVVLYVLTRVGFAKLLAFPLSDQNSIDVSANDLIFGCIALGAVGVALSALMSWAVTRRAVRPLGTALRIQRAFVSDASHELRTPLTVLDARLQVLQRTLSPGDPSEQIVRSLRQDTKSLIAIVNDLLDAAETGSSATKGAPAELTAAIGSTVSALRIIGETRHIGIEFIAPHPVWTSLPVTGANRVATALIDNALRYSPDGSTVRVAVTRDRSNVLLSVADEGPGISGIDPARIFDRFAHTTAPSTDPARSQQGFGIGLALVRDLALQHGGSVRVDTTVRTGTRILMTLPAVDPR
jgi:signal transduction histidine kinase